MNPARLPSAESLVRRARAITIAAMSLGGGAVGGLLVSLWLGGSPRGEFSNGGLAAFLSTTLLSGAVIALSLRPTAGLSSAIQWSVLCGFLDVPACWLFCATSRVFVEDEAVSVAYRGWLALLPYAIPAALVSVPLGVAFGLAYAPVVIAVRHQLERPALDLLERVALRLAVFLAFCGVVALALAPDLEGGALVTAAMSLLVPVVLLSEWRVAARRRWLARVASGKERSFCIVPVAHADVPRETLHLSPEHVSEHAVVRREDLPTYRTRPRALLVG